MSTSQETYRVWMLFNNQGGVVEVQYLVVNRKTHQVQSAWPRLHKATAIAKDLNAVEKQAQFRAKMNRYSTEFLTSETSSSGPGALRPEGA